MGIILSKRKADANLLMTRISTDPSFENLMKTGKFDEEGLKTAIAYVAEHYSAGEAQAEDVVQHYLRQYRTKTAAFLGNHSTKKAEESLRNAVNSLIRIGQRRSAQAEAPAITIPPTDGSPTPKKVPVDVTAGQPLAESGGQLTIDATPATGDDQKKQVMNKSVDDKGESRQQQLINGTKALKISIGEVALAMYGIALDDGNCDKVVAKVIELIANLEGEQTSATVLSLLSPLIKQ